MPMNGSKAIRYFLSENRDPRPKKQVHQNGIVEKDLHKIFWHGVTQCRAFPSHNNRGMYDFDSVDIYC